MSESKIVVSYNDSISTEFFSEFVDRIQDADITSELKGRHVGPQAAIEWMTVTAVALWILTPFLNDIRSRTAKNVGDYVYPKVISAIGMLAEKVLRKTDWKNVTAPGLEKPREGRSAFFSVVSETNQRLKIQFVFEEACEADEYETMVDKAIKLLLSHHTDGSADSLADAPVIWETIYMGFDFKNSQWIPINVDEEIRAQSDRESNG